MAGENKLIFEKRYFVQSDISNYKDYRKRKWVLLAQDLVKLLDLKPETRILDFGCATGGLLKELKNQGLEHLKGTDISYWSISYGHEHYGLKEELDFYNLNLLTGGFDIVFFLDVLEHVPTSEEILRLLELCNSKLIVVRVPVSAKEGEAFVLPVSRNDVTHVQCHTKEWWDSLFIDCGYTLDHVLEGSAIYDSPGVYAGVFRRFR